MLLSPDACFRFFFCFFLAWVCRCRWVRFQLWKYWCLVCQWSGHVCKSDCVWGHMFVFIYNVYWQFCDPPVVLNCSGFGGFIYQSASFFVSVFVRIISPLSFGLHCAFTYTRVSYINIIWANTICSSEALVFSSYSSFIFWTRQDKS